jgi:hypothetical protein
MFDGLIIIDYELLLQTQQEHVTTAESVLILEFVLDGISSVRLVSQQFKSNCCIHGKLEQ